jgi:hypothetical protein
MSKSFHNNPEVIKKVNSKISAIKLDPDSLVFIFLLGVISTKWWINHNKKRIRVYLPESKRYLAQALKLEWGGTVSNINRDKHRGVMWQTTSTRSLKQIEEAAKLVKAWLPPEFYRQLIGFTRVYV